MVSNGYPELKSCGTLFSRLGEVEFAPEVLLCDGWLSTTGDTVASRDAGWLSSQLLRGQIAWFQGRAGSYPVGALQYVQEGQFHTELWLDTARFPELDTSPPSPFCRSFCQEIAEQVAALSKRTPIRYFAMGTELVLPDSGLWETRLSESHNLLCYGTSGEDETWNMIYTT